MESKIVFINEKSVESENNGRKKFVSILIDIINFIIIFSII